MATNHTDAAAETCILEKRGDLWLRTGKHDDLNPAIDFLVDSKALARHSRVFDKMLFGDFAESKQDSDAEPSWSVDLPDDLSTPLGWVLRVMHGDFKSAEVSRFPDASARRSIFQLAVVADKYDCFELFRPWTVSWHHALIPELTTDYAGLCELAWTAYVFGDVSRYEGAMTKLIVHFDATSVGLRPLPAGINDSSFELRACVDAARKKLYANLLEEVQEPLDILINKPSEAKYCRPIKPTPVPSLFGAPLTPGTKDRETKDCESRILGKLIQDLARAGLWPLPTVDSVRISPLQLGSKLDGIPMSPARASHAPSFGSPAQHANCGLLPAVSSVPLVANSVSTSLFAFKAMTISKTTNYKYQCTAQESNHLKAQAGRTGAPT